MSCKAIVNAVLMLTSDLKKHNISWLSKPCIQKYSWLYLLIYVQGNITNKVAWNNFSSS
jgi:hypothetical protein